MRSSRKLVAAIGLLTVLMLLAGMTASASASDARPRVGTAPTAAKDVTQVAAGVCYQGYFCMWQHTNGGGRGWAGTVGRYSLAVDNFNDMASSWWNLTSRHWCVYEHIFYGGRRIRVLPGTYTAAVPSWFNDRASSLRRRGAAEGC